MISDYVGTPLAQRMGEFPFLFGYKYLHTYPYLSMKGMNSMRKSKAISMIVASLFALSLVFLTNAVTAEAAPATPSGLKQIDASNTSVEVTWSSVLGNDISYVVAYSENQRDWVEEHTSSNSDTIIGLTAGKTYFVKVKAVTDWYSDTKRQDGTYSSVLQVVTVPAVTTETMTQTGATQNSITVNWVAVPGSTSYVVTYYSNGKENIVTETTATSATITGLAADSSYSVYVYPVRTSATGFKAVYDYEYLYKSGIETTPGKLTIKVTDRHPTKNNLEVMYTYASNADGYEVYLYDAKGKQKAKKTATSTTYTFTKRKTTDTFYVAVRGYVNVNGTKKYGPLSSKVLTVGAPKAKEEKIVGNGVKLSWNKVPNAKKYVVYMSSTSGTKGYKKVATLSSKKTSVTLKKFKGKSFQKYKNYYYKVEAQVKVGKKTKKSDLFYYNYFWIYTTFK